MGGEAVFDLTIDQRGIQFDRIFAVQDAEGKIGSGVNTRRFRRLDGLIELRACHDGHDVIIKFQDGEILRASDPGMEMKLSAALGVSLTLRAEENIPHLDAAPIHIISTNQLDSLQRDLPHADIDAVRFRPNIVLNLVAETESETSLIGRRLQIGADVEVEITEATERCRMVSFQQGLLEDCPEILRHLVNNKKQKFGVYARPLVAGSVKVGDRIFLVE